MDMNMRKIDFFIYIYNYNKANFCVGNIFLCICYALA